MGISNTHQIKLWICALFTRSYISQCHYSYSHLQLIDFHHQPHNKAGFMIKVSWHKPDYYKAKYFCCLILSLLQQRAPNHRCRYSFSIILLWLLIGIISIDQPCTSICPVLKIMVLLNSSRFYPTWLHGVRDHQTVNKLIVRKFKNLIYSRALIIYAYVCHPYVNTSISHIPKGTNGRITFSLNTPRNTV